MLILSIPEKKKLNKIIGANRLVASDNPDNRRAFLIELEVFEFCGGLDLKAPTPDFVSLLRTHLASLDPPREREFIQNFLEMYEDELSEPQRAFLNEILSRKPDDPEPEAEPESSGGKAARADRSILIKFDLDEMASEFRKQLRFENGPFAFSLSAPDSHVGQFFYAERFAEELSIKREKKPKLKSVRLFEQDRLKNDHLLDRLRWEFKCSIREWFQKNPNLDLMVFARNEDSSGIDAGEMFEIVTDCWSVVMERHADLLGKQNQCFVIFWCNVGLDSERKLIPPVQIEAERFFLLNSPDRFDLGQIEIHWSSKLMGKVGLDEFTTNLHVKTLLECNGDVKATYTQMCEILNKLNQARGGVHAQY